MLIGLRAGGDDGGWRGAAAVVGHTLQDRLGRCVTYALVVGLCSTGDARVGKGRRRTKIRSKNLFGAGGKSGRSWQVRDEEKRGSQCRYR